MLKVIPAVGALIVASALLVPTVSQAATATESVRVAFADLDLASPAGRVALDRRIQSAARSVCDYGDTRDLTLLTDGERCRRQAIVDAAPAVQLAVNAGGSGQAIGLASAALTVTRG